MCNEGPQFQTIKKLSKFTEFFFCLLKRWNNITTDNYNFETLGSFCITNQVLKM